MSEIKSEFEKAFEEFINPHNYPEYVLQNARLSKPLALWAAKWMAERCANELYGQKIADGSDPGETIRQLSKELE